MGAFEKKDWHCTMARHMNIHYSFCQTSFSFGEIHQLILSLLQDMNQILKSTGPKSFYGINQKCSLYAYNNYVLAFHCSPIPLEQTCERG